jgi:cell wall-associated NlpC family hydrolase
MQARLCLYVVMILVLSQKADARHTMPAAMDSILISDTTRARIIEKARAFMGVQYKYGNSDENGFDCSGYVKFVYCNFGYSLPHSSSAQYAISRHIKAPEALPGDLVFFKTRGTQISHVGIYLGNNLFIHAPSRGKSVSIDSLDGIYYKKHLAGFGTVL